MSSVRAIVARFCLIAVIVLSLCMAVVVVPPLGLLALIAVGIAYRKPPPPRPGYSQGSSRFASVTELEQAGYVNEPHGLFVGEAMRMEDQQTINVRELFTAPWSESAEIMSRFGKRRHCPTVYFPQFQNVSIFGSTGSGKGVSLVSTQLFRYPWPIILIDPKLEGHDIASRYREQVFGRKTFLVDPYNLNRLGRRSDQCNPLGLIDPCSNRAPDLVHRLTNALVDRTGMEREPFFPNMAELFLQATMLLVLKQGKIEDRHLGTVADLLADPVAFAGCLATMRDSPAWGGILRRLGGQMVQPTGRELGSIMSTIAEKLRWLNSEPVMAVQRANTFVPEDLRVGGDLYIGLAPEEMKTKRGLIRYLLTGFITGLMQGPPDQSRPILIIIDEAALVCEQMAIVEEAVAVARGWGLKFVFVWQALGQVHTCFPDGRANTFLSNMGHQLYLSGLNNYATAEHVSAQLGDATVFSTSVSTSSNYSRPIDNYIRTNPQSGASYSTGTSVSYNETRRRLLTPEEVLQLPERCMIAFTPHTPPIALGQVRYYDADFVAGREYRRTTTNVAVGLIFVALLVLLVGLVGMVLVAAQK